MCEIIIFLFEGHNQGKGFENKVCIIKKKVVTLRTITKLLSMLTIVVIHSDGVKLAEKYKDDNIRVKRGNISLFKFIGRGHRIQFIF